MKHKSAPFFFKLAKFRQKAKLKIKNWKNEIFYKFQSPKVRKKEKEKITRCLYFDLECCSYSYNARTYSF